MSDPFDDDNVDAEWRVFFDGDDRYSWERFTQREPVHVRDED